MCATQEILSPPEWQARAAAHRKWAETWTVPVRERKFRREVHPVYDFLFVYYTFPPSLLEYWHPGLDYALEIAGEGQLWLSDNCYTREKDVLRLDPTKLDTKNRERLTHHLALCKTLLVRPPAFGCYGIHEWAMVYQADKHGGTRHREKAPLRLSQAQVNEFVETQPICCSHYDAFRFFMPEARPLNRIQPTRERKFEHEQPGCLHANMDIYKWTAAAMPWVGSDILRRSFELAVQARLLDMKASPYDLTHYGFDPICIETKAGRERYETEQRALAKRAVPIRAELVSRLQAVLQE